ncbi:uncharacterized protein T551_00260 [Pneumocystis jirovecii RU7]|uniref:EXS domain-containing protein n=1 Tax=Pneumocystis jirovecii (strain RU7) TaxID=1408657 RepID=A0A0W4ZWM7_PNEJ7|nr:uncharacterized protein T551_00260 [Pneumocystis jirovecii RU7]KTW32775.1 hypothetical protein T551_00260 [Pneumocystis jirovecii RU7]
MKYAKKLENNLVSEWSEKYLNYKKAKKLITKVSQKKNLKLSDYEILYEKPFIDNLLKNQNLNDFSKDNLNYNNTLDTHFFKKITEPTELTLNTEFQSNITKHKKSYENDKNYNIDLFFPTKLTNDTFCLENNSYILDSYSQYIAGHRKYNINNTNSDLYFKSLDNNDEIFQFFIFLNKELQKVDNFYKEKEKETILRSQQIKKQLHEMNNRQKSKDIKLKKNKRPLNWIDNSITLLHQIYTLFRFAKKKNIKHEKKNHISENIACKIAKKQLKIAIIDFYHETELLKNYRTMNMEAFRKALKKITKVTGINYLKFYMPKITESHFGSSEISNDLMTETENIFAYYFEKNNRKRAIEKLRTKQKTTDYANALFRVGLYLGISLPLLIEGLIYANKILVGELDLVKKYLLQIWGGFFIILLFLLLFGFNCYIWTKSRINYIFIFEFDTRHNLDWKQYLEIPSFIFLLFSLFFWLSFRNFSTSLTNYYPLFFTSIIAIILLNPLPYFHKKSRKWFIISNLRLLFSGLCSVQFRDFFLGDQYNSLLFFCFYNHHFKNLIECDTSYSRLAGFFQTIPGIFRFLQCLRRYYDSRNIFPHLINSGKYTCTILTYIFFSIWKISNDSKHKALYITFALINSLYNSFWDLFMDFSLIQPYAEHPFLKNNLIFKNYWLILEVYYLIIIFDPILRFSWILYFIYIKNTKYLSLVTFIISVIEVFRRFLWNIFRVENEHSINVLRLKVNRDIPLPYKHFTLEKKDEETIIENNTTLKNKDSRHRFFNIAIAASSYQRRHCEDFIHKRHNSDNEKSLEISDEDEFISPALSN